MDHAEWPADTPIHPAAEYFPLYTENRLTELANDIRTHGLAHPIVRDTEGRVLDGRNRLLACLRAGIPPTYEEYGGEPWAYVTSTNIIRRHLTDGERTMIAANMANRHHGQHQPAGRGADVSGDTTTRDLPPNRAQAAEMLDVSPAQVSRGRKVLTHGTDNLIAATSTGHIPVTTAARVAATLPHEEQNAYVAQVLNGADPRATAPAPPRPQPLAPPHDGDIDLRRLRTRSSRKQPTDILHRDMLTRLVDALGGFAAGLDRVTSIDDTITGGEAAQWLGDLSRSITSLTRVRKLLKERNQA